VVVLLPSGLEVRGRRLRQDLGPADFTLVLGRGPVPPWTYRRLRWPDFWVPLDREDALEALLDAYARATSGERVEVACRGGVGRTGTALAALAVLDGLPPARAVAWVRERYHPRAVETPWQRRWLQHLAPTGVEGES
jgi:protein-tyrosine phosphatase